MDASSHPQVIQNVDSNCEIETVLQNHVALNIQNNSENLERNYAIN